jgi:fatty-acyl-CoA synthase
MSIYETNLDKNAANFASLSPLGFLERAAATFPDRVALIHGERSLTWRATYERSRRLASALSRRGLGLGDTVAVMAANIPALYEAHFGVPMCGAVLNALNTRLDAESIAFILEHSEAKILLADREFASTVKAALAKLKNQIPVIDIDDAEITGGEFIGEMEYEAFIAGGDPAFAWRPPADEWQAISLNYTSGTTGNPKGVVYHHRGAYLNALGNIVTWGGMGGGTVYLWTLPTG